MYAVVDLETTNKHPGRGEILTLACIVADKNFKEVDRFEGKIKPQYWEQWDEGAEKIHGITKQSASNFSNCIDVVTGLNNFLYDLSDNGDYSFVCHAQPGTSDVDLFDRNFIFFTYLYLGLRCDYYKLFTESRIRSTISRKRKATTMMYGIKNQKLDTWMDKLGIDKTKHHDAMFDTEVCLEILKYQERFV